MQHQIVWVDIPVRDLERSVKFYSAVLNMEVSLQEYGDYRFALLPHENNNVAGCLVPSHESEPSLNGPLIYLNCDGRLAAGVQAAKAHGGKVLEEPKMIGPHGFRAVIVDSEGNKLALHSSKPDA